MAYKQKKIHNIVNKAYTQKKIHIIANIHMISQLIHKKRFRILFQTNIAIINKKKITAYKQKKISQHDFTTYKQKKITALLFHI